MAELKDKTQGIPASARPRDIYAVKGEHDSIYESLVVIARRAKQISVDMKHELLGKLEEFATTPETIEEVTENKEQIEISKFYERLPNPAIIATEEFLNGELVSVRKENKEF